jgi:hypothetical protein
MHGGHSVVHVNQVTMHLPIHRIIIPIELGGTNLPVSYTLFVSQRKKEDIGPQMRLWLAFSRLSKLDSFGDLDSIETLQAENLLSEKIDVERDFKHYSQFCGSCVGTPANQNITNPQK